jgi:hypothetical protein
MPGRNWAKPTGGLKKETHLIMTNMAGGGGDKEDEWKN